MKTLQGGACIYVSLLQQLKDGSLHIKMLQTILTYQHTFVELQPLCTLSKDTEATEKSDIENTLKVREYEWIWFQEFRRHVGNLVDKFAAIEPSK